MVPVLVRRVGSNQLDGASAAEVSAAGTLVTSSLQGMMGPNDYNYLYSLSNFVWRGVWNSIATYVVNNAVSYEGSSYICVSDRSPNVSPPNVDPGHWDVMAVSGVAVPNGTYNNPTSIVISNGQIVSIT